MSRPPGILVLGAPRTGTSLLSTLLGAHRAVAMLDEDIYGASRRIVGGKIPANKLCMPSQIHPTQRRSRFYGLFRLNGYLRKHFVYRVPSSYVSIADYGNSFDLKIICIVRNPVRAVESIMDRERLSRKEAIDLMRRCFDSFDTIMADANLDVRMINFERMLLDAEGQSRALCEWLGVDFDPKMLEAPEHNRRYPAKSFDASKAEVNELGAAAQDLKELVARWEGYVKQSF